MLKEKELESQILDYLNRSGVFAWKVNSEGSFDQETGAYRRRGRFSLKGVSDIIGLTPSDGRLLAIEVKRPGHRRGVTDEQLAFLGKITRMGGHALLVDSLKEVQDWWNSVQTSGTRSDKSI